MEKHLHYYAQHSQYSEPTNKPAVSYCELEDEVHYHPLVEYIVTAYVYVEEGDYPTIIGHLEDGEEWTYYYDSFDEIRVDGTPISITDLVNNAGRLTDDENHVVTYKLKSNVISGDAFLNCWGVREVIIPDGVIEIGTNASYGCFAYSNINSITIPNSVTTIDGYAFLMSNLSSIVIPNSVTNIGNGVFYGCTSLTSVTIPNSVTSIGNDAFSGCSSLTSVTIPNSVISIGENAFAGCNNLTSITMSTNLTRIKKQAFEGCSSLVSFDIPNAVVIEDYVFCNCSSLSQSFRSAISSKNATALECEEYEETGA